MTAPYDLERVVAVGVFTLAAGFASLIYTLGAPLIAVAAPAVTPIVLLGLLAMDSNVQAEAGAGA